MTSTITLTPAKHHTTITYNLTGLPDITTGPDTLVPYRITLTYRQEPGAPIPAIIEATIKGWFREPDGTTSHMSNTAEVWHSIPANERTPEIRDIVHNNMPDWWAE